MEVHGQDRLCKVPRAHVELAYPLLHGKRTEKQLAATAAAGPLTPSIVCSLGLAATVGAMFEIWRVFFLR